MLRIPKSLFKHNKSLLPDIHTTQAQKSKSLTSLWMDVFNLLTETRPFKDHSDWILMRKQVYQTMRAKREVNISYPLRWTDSILSFQYSIVPHISTPLPLTTRRVMGGQWDQTIWTICVVCKLLMAIPDGMIFPKRSPFNTFKYQWKWW